jgi:hypothetical protein
MAQARECLVVIKTTSELDKLLNPDFASKRSQPAKVAAAANTDETHGVRPEIVGGVSRRVDEKLDTVLMRYVADVANGGQSRLCPALAEASNVFEVFARDSGAHDPDAPWRYSRPLDCGAGARVVAYEDDVRLLERRALRG